MVASEKYTEEVIDMGAQILDTLNRVCKSYKSGIPYKKYNLSENEYKILYALEELGAINSFAFLKDKVKLHDSQISVLLSSLNSKGYVIRKKSENDRRSVDMSITDEGREAMLGLKDEIAKLEDYLKNALGEKNAEEYIELSNLLTKAIKSNK